MKASDDKYKSSGRPKIVQDDIEDGDAVVVTVSDVEEEKVKGDKGDKILLTLTTEEFGDKVHRLNKTQIGYMIERLGDETDNWIGEKVPLVKTKQEYQGKAVATVWVAPPELWGTIFKAAGIGAKKGPAPRTARVGKAKKRR